MPVSWRPERRPVPRWPAVRRRFLQWVVRRDVPARLVVRALSDVPKDHGHVDGDHQPQHPAHGRPAGAPGEGERRRAEDRPDQAPHSQPEPRPQCTARGRRLTARTHRNRHSFLQRTLRRGRSPKGDRTVLPDADDLPELLLDLAVPHEDINELVGLRRTVTGDPAVMRLLAECVEELVQDLGKPGRTPRIEERIAAAPAALGRYFAVYVFLA